jgi:hypothetical protein
MAIQTLQANLAINETIFAVKEDGSPLQILTAPPIVNPGSVPAWFVNAATPAPPGAQDGQTPGTAFATTEQLSAALCPGGAIYQPNQNTILNLAAGDYGRFYLKLSNPGFTVLLLGTHSSEAPVALVDVGQPATGQQGTMGPLSFGSGYQNKRVRVLTGPAAGAICFPSTGVPAPGNQGFFSCYRESDGASPFPVVGNSVQIETITTTLQRLDIDSAMAGGSNPGNGQFIVRDVSQMQVIRTRASGLLPSISECGFPVTCQVVSDGVSLDFVNCSNTQPLTLYGFGTTFSGCINRSTIQLLNASVRVLAQCSTSSGNWTVSSPVAMGLGSRGFASLVFVNDHFWEGGGAALTCVTLGPGGSCYVNARWAGTSIGGPWVTLATMTSGAWFYYQQASLITISVANAFVITGHAGVPLAPICYPRANCGAALLSDPGAVAQTT